MEHYYKKQTYQIFNYSVHAIGSEDDYRVALSMLPAGANFLPSCDGFQWIHADLARALTALFLKDGRFGYELLEGVWEQYGKLRGNEVYDFTQINWEPGEASMGALKDYTRE